MRMEKATYLSDVISMGYIARSEGLLNFPGNRPRSEEKPSKQLV